MNAPTWTHDPIANIHEQDILAAQRHQNSLTKPPGSLGQLEEVAIKFCAWQKTSRPCLDNIVIRIFAADHGVAQRGVSAFPQAVTGQMIRNFSSGGAAISVLSRHLDADFAVVNLGTVQTLEPMDKVFNRIIAPQTGDFTLMPAMTSQQCADALDIGKSMVEQADKTHVFVGGEMGIANTTSASAIFSALLDIDPNNVVGPGTGIDAETIVLKRRVVGDALAFHGENIKTPFDALMCLGGFEIAALTGAYIACAQRGIPVVVDGFICTSAALLAEQIAPGASRWMLFSHLSKEPAHSLTLEKLGAEPLLSLGLRLGEGSGAALAMTLIRSAINLHNSMATFDDAAVSKA